MATDEGEWTHTSVRPPHSKHGVDPDHWEDLCSTAWKSYSTGLNPDAPGRLRVGQTVTVTAVLALQPGLRVGSRTEDRAGRADHCNPSVVIGLAGERHRGLRGHLGSQRIVLARTIERNGSCRAVDGDQDSTLLVALFGAGRRGSGQRL